jgi:GNAT superfamily N-acetyltransferase
MTADARVIRFDEDVSFLVDDLFRETFGDPPPRDPVHYVAFVKTAPSSVDIAGYYHVAHGDGYALVGGLCVAPRYRRMGIGEALERMAFEFPGSAKAFFAYVGDPKRALHVGFERTSFPHLMVSWRVPMIGEEKERLIQAVANIGPF